MKKVQVNPDSKVNPDPDKVKPFKKFYVIIVIPGRAKNSEIFRMKTAKMFPAEFQQAYSVLSYLAFKSWKLFYLICCRISDWKKKLESIP